jgi:PAS domain-containing protein
VEEGSKTVFQLIEELETARKEIKRLRSRARKYERIEEALTTSEHFYRTLFENSGTATIVIEEDTTISMMNNDFANFTGYPREEIIGRPLHLFEGKCKYRYGIRDGCFGDGSYHVIPSGIHSLRDTEKNHII